MYTATAHTLTTITAIQNIYPPGKVERRIIAYYFEGLKYELYNMISLKLGRDSREGETCKNKLRKLLAAIKRTCYEMINEELLTTHKLDGKAIAGIVGYVVMPNDILNSPLWQQLNPLLDFAFSRHRGAVDYIRDEVCKYVMNRTPLIETQYKTQWAGAVEYIDHYRRDNKGSNT